MATSTRGWGASGSATKLRPCAACAGAACCANDCRGARNGTTAAENIRERNGYRLCIRVLVKAIPSIKRGNVLAADEAAVNAWPIAGKYILGHCAACRGLRQTTQIGLEARLAYLVWDREGGTRALPRSTDGHTSSVLFIRRTSSGPRHRKCYAPFALVQEPRRFALFSHGAPERISPALQSR